MGKEISRVGSDYSLRSILRAMNLTSPREVTEVLEQRKIRPNKTLGQNFLIDRNILNIIVDSAELYPEAKVVEVGAGLGVLTEQLVAKSSHVTAIEKDSGLYDILSERFCGEERLKLIHGDALDVDFEEIFKSGVTRLVSNLPYSVGVRVVVNAIACENAPEVMSLLLQKEVGERFAAKQGTSDMGVVTVWLQQLYDVTLVHNVKPSCFYPKPDVISTIIKLKKHNRFPLEKGESVFFKQLTKTAFLHRRKQLASAMRNAPNGLARTAEFIRTALHTIGAPETARPEEISVEQWIRLAKEWSS